MASSDGEAFQLSGHEARKLNDQELLKLKSDTGLVSDFKQNKLEVEAQKNWDLFYKRNTTKFFKDRHWTKREFEELTNSFKITSDRQVIFEIGCGVGNFMFPLLADDPDVVFYACDFSPRAIDFVKSHPDYDAERCTAFQCDITKDSITDTVPKDSVDVATLIFVLSAIHPDKMVDAVRNLVEALKPGGVLLIRDYGLYDHAMLRFSKGHKLSDCFYVRQDGTRAYYFSLEKLNSIMEEAGLRTVHSSYIQRSTVNKKEGLDVCRIFVQGKYSKVDTSGSVIESEKQNICQGQETEQTSQSAVQEVQSQGRLMGKKSHDAESCDFSAEPQYAPSDDSPSQDQDLCTGSHSFQDMKIHDTDSGTSPQLDKITTSNFGESAHIVNTRSSHDEASDNTDSHFS